MAPTAPPPEEARFGSGSRETSVNPPPYQIRTRASVAAQLPGLDAARPPSTLRSPGRRARDSGAQALLSPPPTGASRPSVDARSPAAPQSPRTGPSSRSGLRSAVSLGAAAVLPPPGPFSPAGSGRSRAAAQPTPPSQAGATDRLASSPRGRRVSTTRTAVSYLEAAQAELDARNEVRDEASELPANSSDHADVGAEDVPREGIALEPALAAEVTTAPGSPSSHVVRDALTAAFGSLRNVDELVASVESLVVSHRAADADTAAPLDANRGLRPAQALLQAGSHPWETASVASHGRRGDGALASQLASASTRPAPSGASFGGSGPRVGAESLVRPGQSALQGSHFASMESSTEGSVAALVSALSHNARFDSHGASLEDAKKHPGKENKNLSLGLYLLQGTRVGERVFDVSVADGNVYATLLARTRSTLDNRDLPFGIRAPVGHDVLHLLLTLQAEAVSLDTFGPVGASVAPVSMPTKAHVSPPSQNLATSHERALQKARLLRAAYSIPVGDAFASHVGLLYAVALDFEWHPMLFEQYIHRSLQALCDAALECVNDFFRWLRTAGVHVPAALPPLLDLFDEYNELRNCYQEKIIAPLLGPLVDVFLRDQDRRTAHDQRVTAGRREASLRLSSSPSAASSAASGDTSKPKAGPRPAGPPPVGPRPAGPPPNSKAAKAPPANTRAKGGSDASLPAPDRPLNVFCSRKERAAAGRLASGCCLENSTNDGCPKGSACRFPHTALTCEDSSPAVLTVLVAGGGPTYATPIPESERPAVVASLRQLSALAVPPPSHSTSSAASPAPGADEVAGPAFQSSTALPADVAGPAFQPSAALPELPGVHVEVSATHPMGQPLVQAFNADAPLLGFVKPLFTAESIPDDSRMLLVRAYAFVVRQRFPWLAQEPDDVQALVYNHGQLTVADHSDWRLDDVVKHTVAALYRSTLTGSSEAAARMDPAGSRARGPSAMVSCRKTSCVTLEPLLRLGPLPGAAASIAAPVRGYALLLEDACSTLDFGEAIGASHGQCVLLHLAMALGVRPVDFRTACIDEGSAYLAAMDVGSDVSFNSLQKRTFAHDLYVSAGRASGVDSDSVSFDIHLIRFFQADLAVNKRFVVFVDSAQGLEIHVLTGRDFSHFRGPKSAATSYFMLSQGHCRLLNPPVRLGGPSKGAPFQLLCNDDCADAWLATFTIHGLLPRPFVQYSSHCDDSGTISASGLGKCSCCGLPIQTRLSAAGRNVPLPLSVPALPPVPVQLLDFAAQSAIAGVGSGSGGGGLGEGLNLIAAGRNRRARALAGLSAADVAALPISERAIELADRLVDQAKAAVHAIDKKAVRDGDAFHIELLEEAVAQAVLLSTKLMDAAGGLAEAHVAIRQMLGRKNMIPMEGERIRKGFEGRTYPRMVALAADLADYGINFLFTKDPTDSGPARWHLTAEPARHLLLHAALTDVARGGAMLVSACVGNGLKHLDDGGAVYSPLGAVPKKSADGTLDGGVRPINDLQAANARAADEAAEVFDLSGRRRTPAVQPKLANIVREICLLHSSYQVGVFVQPMDFQGAFRLMWTSLLTALEQTTAIPVSPTLRSKLLSVGAEEGRPPVTGDPLFPRQESRLPTPGERGGGKRDVSVLECALSSGLGSFGSSYSPGKFGEGAWTVSSAAAHAGFAEKMFHGSHPAGVQVYVDDVFAVSAPLGKAPVTVTNTVINLAECMFNKGCINAEKLTQAGAPGPQHLWCGLEFRLAGLREGGLEDAFILVDRSKLEKLKNYFEGPEYARLGEGVVTSAAHRSATGLLVWCAQTSHILRVLQSLLGVMNPFCEGEFIRPKGDAQRVRALWATYIGAIGVLCTALPHVLTAAGNLRSPLLGARTLREQMQYRRVDLMGSDASLSHVVDSRGAVVLDAHGRPELVGGCSFVCHRTKVWSSSSLSVFLPALRLAFGEDTKIIIFFCELLMVVAGALEVGPAWAGCLIGVPIDNSNVPIDNSNAFYALSKFRSSHPMCQFLLGILARLMVQLKFDVLPLWVSTKDNVVPDVLSREYEMPHPDQHAEVVGVLDGYTRVDIHLRLEYLLNAGWANPVSYGWMLPSDVSGSDGARWDLWSREHFADRVHSPAFRPRLAAEAHAGVGVVELGYGIGQLLAAAQKVGAVPIAQIGATDKTDGVLAIRFGAAVPKIAFESAPAVIDLAPVHVVAVSPTCQSWTELGSAQESNLLRVVLPAVLLRLAPFIVTVIRDVGRFSITVTELDAALLHLGYERVWDAQDETGFAVDVEVADNRDLKGGFAQRRDVLHYERGPMSAILGPPPSLQADLKNPKWIVDTLLPVADVPAHVWLDGHFSPAARCNLRNGGPIGKLTLGYAGSPIGVGSRVLFSHGKDSRPWIVARMLDCKLLLHLEAGGHTTTVKLGYPLHELIHLPRDIPVYSVYGSGPGLRVSAAEPLGPVNAVICDDRAAPGAKHFRWMVEHELLSLVGIPIDAKAKVPLPLARRQRIWSSAVTEEMAHAVVGRAVSRAALALEQREYADGEGPSLSASTSTRARGGPSKRDVRCHPSVSLRDAVTALLSASVHLSSRSTYYSQYSHWVRFCTALGVDSFMEGWSLVAVQELLVEFIAYKGFVQGYAHATVHVMLFAVRHFHLLNRCPDPLIEAPLYKVAMKGLKNLQGGSVQKVAATPDLLLEALKELDLAVWDDLVMALGLSVMFVFLLRAGEALSTGGHANPECGLRVQDLILAVHGKSVEAWTQDDADELVLLKGKSKADQEGMGHMANAFRADHPLCPVALFQRAARMNPGHFSAKERFLLTKSNGRVLSRDEVAALLRRAGERLGMPRGALSVISLRSGGASAMFHEGYSAEEIKRRGRWQSECWRTYVWTSRERNHELAGKMLTSSFSLLASLARYERRA